MITTCPHCDAMVPMNMEIAINSLNQDILCACCNLVFKPFEPSISAEDLSVEAIKDSLVIENSRRNIHRWFEDCWYPTFPVY